MNHVLLFSPGPTEIIVLVLIILLLFGGRKIPELMRGLGRGMKEFKNAQKEDEEDGKSAEKSSNEKKE
ncbi:MAG: twin-arginine translocase TatA/TatE family subunit [Bacteroidales bacterium]